MESLAAAKMATAASSGLELGFRSRIAVAPKRRTTVEVTTCPSSRFVPLTLVCRVQTRSDADGTGTSGGVAGRKTRRRVSNGRYRSGKPNGNGLSGLNTSTLLSPSRWDEEGVEDCGVSPNNVRMLYQNGDPMGKRELGRCIVRWITQGMRSMAADFAGAEVRGEFTEEVRQRMGFVGNGYSGGGGIRTGGGTGSLML